MWWFIFGLWVIAVAAVIMLCIYSNDYNLDGYVSAMNMYFVYNMSIRDIRWYILTQTNSHDDVFGMYSATDTLDSFGFPDKYDEMYLP